MVITALVFKKLLLCFECTKKDITSQSLECTVRVEQEKIYGDNLVSLALAFLSFEASEDLVHEVISSVHPAWQENKAVNQNHCG